jgi:hypothetical protein
MRYLRFMEIVAHGLWAAAAAVTANRKTGKSIRIGWTVWWAAFPDVLAFGLPAIIGIGLALTGNLDPAAGHGHLIPRARLALPLYPAGHSLIVFLAVFGLVSILARRFVLEMLGWLMHILIDIGTHSLSYYATRFLWPVSDFRVNGIAWWTPWFWAATYVALAIVYIAMWKKGWLSRSRRSDVGDPETCSQSRYG